MACHARRGRTVRAGFLNNDQRKMESARLGFLELHAQATKHVKRLIAVPKLLDTPLVWQQQFAAEHELPKPDTSNVNEARGEEGGGCHHNHTILPAAQHVRSR